MPVLVLACLGQFVVIMDTSIVNVALPSIGRALAFSSAGLAWVVNAYTITFAGFLLPAGRAADVYGRRRVFAFGLALFCLASVAGGLAPSAMVLIAARAVQGIAAAVVSAAALAILIAGFPEGAARNRALAAWGAAAAAGGAIGTLLGGVLTDLISWRAVLLINVPIGLIMIAGAARLLPVGRGSHARGLDLPGALTATAGVAAFAFGVVQASTNGWSAPVTLAPMLAGAAVFGVFLFLEARLTRAPMLPLGLFRSRSLSVGNLLMALVGATSVSMWYFISLYLQRVAGYDPLMAGLAIAPFALAIAAASWATPRIIRWTGRKWLITASSLMATAGFAWWSVSLDPGASYPLAVLLPGLLAATGTSGLVIAPIAGAATAGVRPEETGVASGLANATRMLGGAIGLAVLATLAAGSHTGSPTPQTIAAGYDRAFLIAAGIALVTAAVSLLIPTNRSPSAGNTLVRKRRNRDQLKSCRPGHQHVIGARTHFPRPRRYHDE